MSNPIALVNWARAMLDHPELGLVGTWPRAAALLGRQSLEEALDRFWVRQLPAMSRTTRATQLSCLTHYLSDRDLVHEIRTAWAALSRACHQHPYELAPTAPELDHWLGAAENLIARLEEADVAA